MRDIPASEGGQEKQRNTYWQRRESADRKSAFKAQSPLPAQSNTPTPLHGCDDTFPALLASWHIPQGAMASKKCHNACCHPSVHTGYWRVCPMAYRGSGWKSKVQYSRLRNLSDSPSAGSCEQVK
ncbi:hypothetical [Yersinia pestis KIM10+]|uniref:Uncharacterized protein n=1 Tax=Yersinia pestis TaxID=632 RepID=Q8CKT7_YERPE|nr:hypothetical [Yersinia pestis KIM10+]